LTHLLIDADILIFKATTSSEKPIEWSEGFWTMHGFEDDALRYLNDRVSLWTDKFKATKVTYCLTDSNNWRKEILPTYKANRKGTRKPLMLPVLRDILLDKYSAQIWDTLEADDILGILATEDTDEKRIVISEDKDLKTIPCTLYNPDKETVTEITQRDADYWHMFQTLVGDSTDNFAGCPSIGPVTAHKLLTTTGTPEEMWKMVVTAYRRQSLGEDFALTQARVARILRSEDFYKKEVKYWNPPQIS